MGDRPLMELLEEVVYEGVVTCPKCGNTLEPDAEKCYCGWQNPLVARGLI